MAKSAAPRKGMIPCIRCQGTGHLSSFQHVEQGVCFECRGSGWGYPRTATKPSKDDTIIKSKDIELMGVQWSICKVTRTIQGKLRSDMDITPWGFDQYIPILERPDNSGRTMTGPPQTPTSALSGISIEINNGRVHLNKTTFPGFLPEYLLVEVFKRVKPALWWRSMYSSDNHDVVTTSWRALVTQLEKLLQARLIT